MSTALIRYEAARNALAEAHRVDEVKDIRDKAEAMAAYARQAKDSELIQYATEIKVRAEQRAGQLTAQMETTQGRRTSSHDAKKSKAEQLADVGLTVQEAHRYEALAAMPTEHFETAVETAKATAGEVTTAFMLREAKKAAPAKQATPKRGKTAERQRQELREAQTRGVSLLCTYARLTIGAMNDLESFTPEERQVLDDLRTALDRVSSFA